MLDIIKTLRETECPMTATYFIQDLPEDFPKPTVGITADEVVLFSWEINNTYFECKFSDVTDIEAFYHTNLEKEETVWGEDTKTFVFDNHFDACEKIEEIYDAHRS